MWSLEPGQLWDRLASASSRCSRLCSQFPDLRARRVPSPSVSSLLSRPGKASPCNLTLTPASLCRTNTLAFLQKDLFHINTFINNTYDKRHVSSSVIKIKLEDMKFCCVILLLDVMPETRASFRSLI